MENAQMLNLQPLRSNDELERENAELRKTLQKDKDARKALARYFSDEIAEEVEAYFSQEVDIMQEVNNHIADLDTSGLDLNLWDYEDEIRDVLNTILKNSTIKLELY